MLGSEIASEVIYAGLRGLPDAAPFLGKIVGADIIPQGDKLPAVTFAPEFSVYDGPLGTPNAGAPITYETLRFALHIMCAGLSTDPILALYKAQFTYFNGSSFSTTYDGQSYEVTFLAQGESMPTTIADGANYYRQLGTVYTVAVTTGG